MNCSNIHPIPQIWFPLTSLFPEIKLFLAGQRFSSNQEAIAAVEGYFADLTKNHYRVGIMALEHHWNKCIRLKGDYVKKIKIILKLVFSLLGRELFRAPSYNSKGLCKKCHT
jgi:hypothetical protein